MQPIKVAALVVAWIYGVEVHGRTSPAASEGLLTSATPLSGCHCELRDLCIRYNARRLVAKRDGCSTSDLIARGVARCGKKTTRMMTRE